MPTSDLSPAGRSENWIGLSKDLFLLVLVIAIFATFAPVAATDGEAPRLKIAFEISSGTDHAFQAFLANVEGLQKNFGDLADITVVATYEGVGLFRETGNSFEKRLAKLADRGVDFIVCTDALKAAEMENSDLLGFARTVRSGRTEIERLKEQGWAHVPDGESYVSHL